MTSENHCVSPLLAQYHSMPDAGTWESQRWRIRKPGASGSLMEDRQPGYNESYSSELFEMLLTAQACHWCSGTVRWLRWPHPWTKAFFCLGRYGLNVKFTPIVSCVWRLPVLCWKHCFWKVIDVYRGGGLVEKVSHCGRFYSLALLPAFSLSLTLNRRPDASHICRHAFLTKILSSTEGKNKPSIP